MMTTRISKQPIHIEDILDPYFQLLQTRERYLKKHIFILLEVKVSLGFGKCHPYLKKMYRAMGKTTVLEYFLPIKM